ncbi:MAG TPA: protein kinase [Gemmatimonadales bacterium]
MADLLQDRVVAAIGDLYDVEGELGRGGTAVVYRAMDVRLRRRVALKVLPPDLAFRREVRERFLREAQTAAQLSHASIVPIYSVDERDGLVYFVMCLVEGESLAARLRREPRPPIAAVQRVLREVADALAYAHSRGVVHRDIKPDNILLDRDSGRAMVTDFGIARALEEGARLTVTGIAVGTPAYMSPEQALGEREVDARSDVYSLGVVGYQMLAGEPPFRATNTPAMLMKHISETPVPLHLRRPDLPPALVAAVERAMAKRPEDRWGDASHFREALLGALTVPAAPPGSPASRSLTAPASGDPFARGRSGLAAMPGGNDGAGLPQEPPFPASGRREEVERWRAEQRRWREQVRVAGAAAAPAAAPDTPYVPAAPAAPADPLLLEQRFHLFRSRAKSAAFWVGFLGFINLVTFPFVPWAYFVWRAKWRPLRPSWSSLRDAGVTWGDVIDGRLPPHLGGRDPRLVKLEARERDKLARLEAREEMRRARVLVHWRDIGALERRAGRFRAAAFTSMGAAGVTVASTFVGAAAGADPLAVVAVMSGMTTMGAGMYAGLVGRRLRKAGVRLRDMLKDGWRATLRAADPRPKSQLIDEELVRLVSPEVAAGPHGARVRRALEDSAEIRESFERMSEADRAMLPDVTTTVRGLVDRVVLLAQALHRLDQDRPQVMLAAVEARLADAEREAADTPDRERRLGLLQRQRTTLQDLVRRRNTLASQLESAALVLESVRLDLLKLRSAGLQAALEDVTSATQEARALSREIGHVLDAADEVRAI